MFDSEISGLEADALCGNWPPGTVIAVLKAFWDESGEHDASGKLKKLTLGGYFCRWESAQRLCERWRAALADEHLSEFHMKEFASDEHDFWNWHPARQKRLIRFVDILCDESEEFGAFTYPVTQPDRAFKDTYESALARIMIAAETLADRAGERIYLEFAHTEEMSEARVGEYFDFPSHWTNALAGYAVRKSKWEPALQAAEIVARGMKRFMQDETITYSFGRLILTGKPFRFWPENPSSASAALHASAKRATLP